MSANVLIKQVGWYERLKELRQCHESFVCDRLKKKTFKITNNTKVVRYVSPAQKSSNRFSKSGQTGFVPEFGHNPYVMRTVTKGPPGEQNRFENRFGERV